MISDSINELFYQYPDELRLALAMILGAIIGTERQLRHKMAGMRTNALVAIGACMFVIIGVKIHTDQSSAARVAAQIASGIGFLGAGVIMKDNFNISGLNTAATIWCSGAIGALSGMGFWYEAFLGTGCVLVSHILLKPLGKRVTNRYSSPEVDEHRYNLKVSCSILAETRIRDLILEFVEKLSMRVVNVSVEYDKMKKESVVEIELLSKTVSNENINSMMRVINEDEEVSMAIWEMEVDGH